MTGLYVFLGILFAFWLVGMIAARIHIVYDGAFKLYVTLLGIIKIRIKPSDKDLLDDPDLSPKRKEKIRKKLAKAKIKKKEKLKKKKAKKKAKEELERKKKLEQENAPRKKKPEEKPKGKKKLTLKEILYIVKLATRVLKIFLWRFKKYLYIKAVKIRIKVASDDAAKTAYMHGAIVAALRTLIAVLEETVNFEAVRNKNIGVDVDFLSEKLEADIHIVLRIRVWHLLALVFGAVFTAIGYYIKHPMGGDTKNGHKVGKKQKPKGKPRKKAQKKSNNENK